MLPNWVRICTDQVSQMAWGEKAGQRVGLGRCGQGERVGRGGKLSGVTAEGAVGQG